MNIVYKIWYKGISIRSPWHWMLHPVVLFQPFLQCHCIEFPRFEGDFLSHNYTWKSQWNLVKVNQYLSGVSGNTSGVLPVAIAHFLLSALILERSLPLTVVWDGELVLFNPSRLQAQTLSWIKPMLMSGTFWWLGDLEELLVGTCFKGEKTKADNPEGERNPLKQ